MPDRIFGDTQTDERRSPNEIARTRADPERDKVILESPEWQDRLKKLIGFRRQARIAQADNRLEMATDEDYFDSIQFDADEIETLKNRNQAPEVFNIIKNVCNWILGTELKARIDYRILPRTKQGAQEAKTKTKLHKYIQDMNNGEFLRSKAFQDCIKAGVGWLDIGVRNVTLGEEPIYWTQEDWRNVWFDHLGKSLDCRDWRFLVRDKWIDSDIGIAMFPGRENDLRALSESVNSLYPYMPDDIVISDDASQFDMESEMDALFGGPYSGSRERMKMSEMWYRMPQQVKIMRMVDHDTPYGALDGTIYREGHEDHDYLVKGGYFSAFDTVMLVVRQAIWAGPHYLQDILTPYNHNRFPLIPMFCYRRKRDNMPYGVVRDLRDPQSDYNRRRSRGLFLLSAQQIIYEEGAINDPIKLREELNRPDGQIVVAKGALQGSKAIDIIKHNDLAQAQLLLAREDSEFIQNIAAGVTSQNLGQTDRNLSGKAIQSLQAQGTVAQGPLFDNYYYAFQAVGEVVASLIEQFYDEEKEVLITGDTQKDEFVTINKRTPQGIDNAIAREKSRFVVGKQDYRESIRLGAQEMLTELMMNLAKAGPDMAKVAFNLLDLVIDNMDVLPNREEMVERIRKLNGQHAADEDMTEEQRAEIEQTRKAMTTEQEAMKQVQMLMVKAQLALAQADVQKRGAEAIKTDVESKMAKLEGYLKAMQAAGMLSQSPQLAKAADALIMEAESSPGAGGNGPAQRQLTDQGGQPPIQ